jgi:hypothetical protein
MVDDARERAPAAPRPWVMAAPVAFGPRIGLIYLWGYGPHWKVGDPLPEHGEAVAWPKRKTIARECGVPLGTVKSWLGVLTRDGWIRRDDQRNRWELAVGTPVEAWVAEAKARRCAGRDDEECGANCEGLPLEPGGGSHWNRGGLPLEPGGAPTGTGWGSHWNRGGLQPEPQDPPVILHRSSK